MGYEITALDDFTESINFLVYSDPGAGKTVLGGTTNGLIIALEPGTISAKRMGSTAQTIRCKDYPEFAEVLNDLRRGKVVNPATGERYEWVVIDTLTELQQMMAQNIMRDAHKVSAKRSATVLDMLGHQEWQSLFKRVVHALNDLPENVLFLCHAMRDEDEDGEPMILPDIAGKNGTQDSTTMSRWVCGTMHAYGYLKVKRGDDGEYRRLIMQRSGAYFGKDRYGVLAPWVDNPNMLDITERILNPPKKKKKEH